MVPHDQEHSIANIVLNRVSGTPWNTMTYVMRRLHTVDISAKSKCEPPCPMENAVISNVE